MYKIYHVKDFHFTMIVVIKTQEFENKNENF